MITKALMARQAHQVDILFQFNFIIMYRPSAINCIDAFIRRKQDLDNQIAAKISLQTQTLLQPEHFDPWIQVKLNTDSLDAKICPVDSMELDLINELLQANCMALSLQEYYKKVKNVISLWSFKNGLLKHWERLIVIKK